MSVVWDYTFHLIKCSETPGASKNATAEKLAAKRAPEQTKD
jgi:hypothetical protein